MENSHIVKYMLQVLTMYLLTSAVVGDDVVEDLLRQKQTVNLRTHLKRTCLKVEHMKP